MKKIIFFVPLILFGLGTIAFANGPDVDYSVSLPAISCGQINSLSRLPGGYAILFDYDDATAEKLGRPWKVVEEGKCYSGGYFLLLLPKAVKILGDSIVHPENYDTKLNIFTFNKNLGMFNTACLTEKLYPGLCPFVEDDDGWFPGVSFSHSSYDILEILNVTLDEAGPIFGLFAEQPEVSKNIPEGLNREITGTEIFKEKYITPRFAACDKRKREAHVFDLITPNQDVLLYDLLTNERIIWTTANGDTREALTGKIVWTKERTNPSDKEILQDFEFMGCLNSVFEIRGIVAKMKDPAIDIAKYVWQEQEKYNNTNMATTTKTVSPQADKTTQPSTMTTPVSQTIITPDDSVVSKETSRDSEKMNRSIYFYFLPPIGLLALLYLLKRKRSHV